MNLNYCCKCDAEENSEELIWITSEDFQPYEGEQLEDEAYEKYDALCEICYCSLLIKKL